MEILEEKQYAIIPYKILHMKNITESEKLLYGLINSLSNDKGHCYASNGYLADILNTTKNTIANRILKLKKNNLIEVEIERDEHKQITTRKIFIIEYTKKETELKNDEEELSKNFDLIWKEYPRKEGKNSAFKHYKSWIKGKKYSGKIIKLTNTQMWNAVHKYKVSIEENKTEYKYIKMGSTFFNEAIYEYVEEVQK